MNEIRFWVVALGAIVLYGFMLWGTYAVPMAMGVDPSTATLRDLITATLSTYAWLPSFLAGLIARRRAVLLGTLTFVGGILCASILEAADPMKPPLVAGIIWNGPIAMPYGVLLSIALSVIASFAGQSVIFRSRSRRLNN